MKPTTDSQVTEDTIPFSQTYSATVFQSDDISNGFTNDNFVDNEVADASEDDDNESFLSEDEESSAASVDLNCDDDVSTEPIDQIPKSGRMTKTIEDYGLKNDIFSESDSKKWKVKEQKLVDRFKNGC